MKKINFYLAGFLTALALAGFSSISNAATITGKVTFNGTAPAVQNIKVDADANCKIMHPDGLTSDDVIVNANGTLKNVFVYVKDGLTGKKFDAPKETVVFDQKGCQYTPKVFGIQVNQPLEIVNSDNTLHNVHSLAAKSKPFNMGMPIQGMKVKKTFTQPEVMVKIKCEVHPWMAAYAGVLDHPFFAVTNDTGVFEIKNLPPGQYVVESWHEKYGVQTQNVTIAADGDTKDTQFEYKAS